MNEFSEYIDFIDVLEFLALYLFHDLVLKTSSKLF
jgi:hypothetical protein